MGNVGTTHARAGAPHRRTRAVLISAGSAAAVLILAVAGWLVWGSPDTGAASPEGTSAIETGDRSAGADPDAPPTDGSEVLPPDEAALPTDHLPSMEPAAPRILAPLPPSGAQEGGVVAGYPTELAAPTHGSEVLDTTVATEGEVMQFTMRAHTGGSAEDVLSHYREEWARIGLAPAGSENGAVSYRDAYSSVTVTAQTGGTGVVYSVHGTLRAG